MVTTLAFNELSDKAKASLKNKLSKVKLLMIDEILIVSDTKLSEIFSTSIKLPIAGLSVVVISDYLQPSTVRGRFIFSKFTSGSKKNKLLSLQLWHLFKFAELEEVVRQSDRVFVNGLNNVSLDTVVESIERLLKAKFIDQYDKKSPHNILHMHPENAPIVLRNQTFLNNLPGDRYSIEANDKIPNGFRYPFSIIQATQNQK